VVDYAKKTKIRGVEVSAAQGIHSILEADRKIIRSQISSAALTAGVIGLILALLWRSIRLSLLCLLANSIPVAFVVASAGIFGAPLNSITIMVAAISLGIGVDNSIHFITFWRREYQEHHDNFAAIQQALKVKGLPILWTNLILIVIFAVFWFSSFPPIVDFGLLSSIAFVGALISIILFIPAVLITNKCHE
jgi:predicted RND superfamily exporter protein